MLAALGSYAAFPGNVLSCGRAELVVCSWLGGRCGEVGGRDFVTCAAGEEISGRRQRAFDVKGRRGIALRRLWDLDEFGRFGADFGEGSGRCELPL